MVNTLESRVEGKKRARAIGVVGVLFSFTAALLESAFYADFFLPTRVVRGQRRQGGRRHG